MLFIIALVILILILILSKRENFEEPNRINLYDNYQYTDPHIYFGNMILDTKVNMKTYDIQARPGGVIKLYGIYGGDTVASSVATGVAGFGSVYTDQLYLYPKMELLAKSTGEHVVGVVDIPVKRVLIVSQ